MASLKEPVSKYEALIALARQRRADRLDGFDSLGDFHAGAYDRHDWVSPWTISAHNVDARLMILLQDWSSSDVLAGPLNSDAVRLGYTPRLQTNKSLIRLVRERFKSPIEDVYVTNLFVFIKRGKINARVPVGPMLYCAKRYAIPQIEIIQPKIVLCVGVHTFNAMRRAQGLSSVRLKEALDSPIRIAGAQVYCVPHTGGLGTAAAGGNERVEEIWRSISERALDIDWRADQRE